MNRKIKISVFLFIVIIINYIITRFIYIDTHKMIDFSNTMSLLSTSLTCLFILSDKELVSLFTSIGNLISFYIGLATYTIEYDVITGSTNNLWLIWLISYILIVLLGMLIDRVFHVKH